MASLEPKRPRCVVFHEGARVPSFAGRTLRALSLLGHEPIDLTEASLVALGRLLPRGPLWLVRAGAWPAHFECSLADPFPPATQRGTPLCALGALLPAPGDEASVEMQAWAALLKECGGDLDRALRRAGHAAFPPLASVYLDAVSATRVSERCARGASLLEALGHASGRGLRVVRYASLDVHDCQRPRVAQVITSLQRGGAERVALELAAELPRNHVRSRVYSVYSPTRGAFELPPGALDLTQVVSPAASREQRFNRLQHELTAWGTDLAHAHLLDAADLARLSARGFRSLVTVHNTRAGFPQGLAELAAEQAVLLVGCARAVESELHAERLPIPLRTVWNGIRIQAPASRASNDGWRARLGLASDALVLLALANPRPQKRLHLLPSILAATRARGGRDVKLIVAGAASPRNQLAQLALTALQSEIERLRVGEHVHLVGLVDDVQGLLAAADVLVSPSEHEGLSLAHLEALAANVPVVASGDGGTRELAAEFATLRQVPLDSAPEAFAHVIVELTEGSGAAKTRESLTRHFGVARMAAQYARLYPRALARNGPRKPGDGIWLVTNNFSLGGAQSSARRLLLGLRAAGVRVRAAVIEEQPEYPTPGRAALIAAGVPVLAVPPPAELEPARAVERLLEAIEQDPPEAVLLWNVIAEHKLLLADGSFDIPLFDVSPGEMYFASLQRYFASFRRPGLPYREPREYGARLAGVVVKYEAEAELAKRVLGCPVQVIPNGVDLSAPTNRVRRESSLLTLGTAIRIHPDKRVLELLAALRAASSRLPPHVLRIAGGVDHGAEAYANELRRASSDLPVEWIGELADTREFLDTLDVFVLIAEPAGCPNASLEAMGRGVPVIATDVGGMREQVVDGVTGKLVARGDTPAFAEALVELCNDAELRARLAQAAFERARQRFSLERMVNAYRAFCLTGAYRSGSALVSTRGLRSCGETPAPTGNEPTLS